MTLGAKLVQAKFEERHNLTGELVCCLEALRVEHDSRNHVLVRSDHSDLSEQLFEIVWKVRTASIAGVHRDEDTHMWVQFDIPSHEIDTLLLFT